MTPLSRAGEMPLALFRDLLRAVLAVTVVMAVPALVFALGVAIGG